MSLQITDEKHIEGSTAKLSYNSRIDTPKLVK